MQTITSLGVMAAALTALLISFGVQVPLAAPALVPLVAGVAIFVVRVYIAFVGAANTSADEKLALAQSLIDSARNMVRPPSTK